jgi:molybdopterin/thiamine biosynthesis adenylyltransferase
MTVHAWRPVVLDPRQAAARNRLESLVKAPNVMIFDTIEAQLEDLLASRHPASSGYERGALARRMLDRGPGWQYGCWVYYPWSGALVHTLGPDEFREARLARNQRKITAEEQARLADRAVAIVGLSVGRQIAHTLAMEGVCGRFRLADGDTLALSNMNRLPARISELGISKAVLAARELFEMDPFLDIEIAPQGLSMDGIDDFIGMGRTPVDLVIEECDDFAIKVGLRQRLRALRIPVIMETSERGTLDIERFDDEPGRPLLHGLLEGVDPGGLCDIGAIKALIAEILPDMRPRTRESVEQVGVTLRSWPQLASEIALGAATVTTAARRILLGQPMRSGRYHVDMEASLDQTAYTNDGAPSPDFCRHQLGRRVDINRTKNPFS